MNENLDIFQFREYIINIFSEKKYKEIDVFFNDMHIKIDKESTVNNIVQSYTNEIVDSFQNTSNCNKIYSIFKRKDH
ncbi:hypothetical protein [Clostridium botulinum]|uniref:hypothetical protein n=1 Tax=Clostridium botulinum TaxID=1491 RepID=UPI003DA6078A